MAVRSEPGPAPLLGPHSALAPSGRSRRDVLRLGLAAAAGWMIPGCRSGRSRHVIVVGGGLSGLVTALLLGDAGVEVTLLEGRRRLGGRLWTLADLPGQPEAGGCYFSERSPLIRALLDRLGVRFASPTGGESGLYLYVGGHAASHESWAESPGNRLQGAERPILPPALLETYLAGDEIGPVPRDRRAVSLSGGDVCLRATLEGLGASAEALRLMQVAEDCGDLRGLSTAWAEWRQRRRREAFRSPRAIEGGSAALIEALEAAREGKTVYGRRIRRVESGAGGVRVICTCGKEYTADRCVLALPPATLRSVEIDPPLDPAQRDAIEGLGSSAVTRCFLRPRAPFWEKDGLPPAMWTDTAVERVLPHRDPSGEIVLLSCVVNGEAARALDRLARDDQSRIVLDALAAARPSSEGQLEVLRTVSWERDPFSRGATCYFGPGQLRGLAPQLAIPWQRLHFTGAHTSLEAVGIEGALASAQRVAVEVLDALG